MQTENFEIGIPMQGQSEAGFPEKQKMEMEEPEVKLEDGTAKRRGVRMSTLERQPPVKRRVDEGHLAVDEELEVAEFDRRLRHGHAQHTEVKGHE